MHITIALPEHLDSILSLIRATILEMQRQGLDQWNDTYPGKDILENDVHSRTLYILQKANKIAGMVVLNADQDPAYKTIRWKQESNKVMVIHRLCIHPEYRGLGCAKVLMDFSENFAGRHHYEVIRLDAYSVNPAAMRLYESRNYLKAGQVYFPGREYPFWCFEKRVPAIIKGDQE